MTTVQDVIESYRTLRDKKEKLKAEHVETLKPYNDGLAQLEAWLLNHLNAQGEQSVKTPSGTAYISTIVKPKVMDAAAFMDFLKENDLLHMLEVRPSKSAVQDYVDSTGDPPPGIHITTESFARIRK